MNPDLFKPKTQLPPPPLPLESLLGQDPAPDPGPPPRTGIFPENPYGGNTFTAGQRERLADMLESAGQEKLAARYRECRQKVLILECKDHCHRPNKKISLNRPEAPLYISPQTCKSRFCEPCARSFGLAWRRKVLPYVKSLVGRSKKRRLAHIVLTWKTQPARLDNTWIRDRFREVAEFVSIFYKQKTKKTGEFLAGAIAVMEMSPEGFFHVHLLAYGYFWPQKTLSDVWLMITGNSPVVYISSAERGPVNAVGEILKYVIKPVSNPSVLDNFYYTQAIKGRRRLHAWGIFYNCDQIKPAARRGECPFCGGRLKKLSEGDRQALDTGELWPAWMVGIALQDPESFADLPDMYKIS